MIYEIKQTKGAAPLFESWQETLIWSCLQGVMGKIYGDSPKEPVSAAAVLGDFCFLAGRPSGDLVLQGTKAWILVPQNREWETLIEDCCGDKARRVTRYAMKKEPDAFDKEKLRAVVDALPHGYRLKGIDKELFELCREIPWCRDWVSQYRDYAMYQRYGLGVVLQKGGEIVSGASSYAGYLGGIEVEIDTRAEYRRRGLARICGAKLILECQKRGWYPSWDAQNPGSAALAEQLGYHLDYAYPAYEIAEEKL